MIRRTCAALCACAMLLLATGCASFRTMPFRNPGEKAEDKKTAVYLLRVTLDNRYRPSFDPRLVTVIVDRKNGDQWEPIFFDADVSGLVVVPGAAVNSYAARLELEPGEYRLRTLSAVFYYLLTSASLSAPAYVPFSVREPRGLFYLGHLRGSLRQASEGDIKPANMTGGIVALELSGAANGTFDIAISDDWRTDESIFRAQFPALANVPIRKAVLPPYDRARVAREMARDAGK
jgi:hypothetical protein